MHDENGDSLAEDASPLYTRSHILAWANQLLKTTYSSLHSIPSHSTALILRSILLERKELLFSSKASHGKTSPYPEVNSFLSLNGIQFVKSDAVPPLVELQNVKFFLQCVVDVNKRFEALNTKYTNADSSSGYPRMAKDHVSDGVSELSRSRSPSVMETGQKEWKGEEESHTTGVPIPPPPPLPTISLSFSVENGEEVAQHWIHGTAFVDTLKVWRWMMTLCHVWKLEPSQLCSSMDSFLQQDCTSRTPNDPTSPTPRSQPDDPDFIPTVGHKRLRPSNFGLCLPEGDDLSSHAQIHQTPMTYDKSLYDRVKEAKAAFSVSSSCETNKDGGTGELPHQKSEHTTTTTKDVVVDSSDMNGQMTLTTSALHHGSNSVRWDILSGHSAVMSSKSVSSGSGAQLETAMSCPRCSLTVAQAIESNKNSIEHLEEIRLAAIQACLKKDSSALMAALSEIV